MIPIPDLKTNYNATADTNVNYTNDFDSDNAKSIQAFEAVDSALDQVFNATGLELAVDLTRRQDALDPVNRRIGHDCFRLENDVILSSGSFVMEARNDEGVHPFWISGSRKQHIGNFAGDLNQLAVDGEIPSSGSWTGDVYIGVGAFSDNDLALAFSTITASVAAIVWKWNLTVTGIDTTPAWTLNKVERHAEGKETVFNGVTLSLIENRPIVFERSFNSTDNSTSDATIHLIRVPFDHILDGMFQYVTQSGIVGISLNARLTRNSPQLLADICNSPNWTPGKVDIGQSSLQFDLPIASEANRVAPAGTWYKIDYSALPTLPFAWTVGIQVRPAFGCIPFS